MSIIIEKIIKDDLQYFAHKSQKKEAENELLREHTRRSQEYYDYIITQMGIDKTTCRIKNYLLNGNSKLCCDSFDILMKNTITFHDFGKINPEFQYKVMSNSVFKRKAIKELKGSNHSLLSSVIYVDYFQNYINNLELEKNDKYFLYNFMMMNAYVIARHHSNLTEFEEFTEQFSKGGGADNIFDALHNGVFKDVYYGPFSRKNDLFHKIFRWKECLLNKFDDKERSEAAMYLYTYIKLMYSCLIMSDYYATSEYMDNLKITDLGNMDNIIDIYDQYKNTELVKKIRKGIAEKEIDKIRNEMFIETENQLLINKDKDIFFLEAPTGGGKSNMAMNSSLLLAKNSMRKIIYVYPFNTLVEQNIDVFSKIFKNNNVFDKMAVINSITPIKLCGKTDNIDEDNTELYKKSLLNRQFLNYPFILTTHVSLFELMFSTNKENAASFCQLTNSVIVFDEIQSYKNTIWTEIMTFLQSFSKILSIKVIIMSATLPKLDYLTGKSSNVINLLPNAKKYFSNPLFKERVNVSYELLDGKCTEDQLLQHIISNSKENGKILVEFIRKSVAKEFYQRLKLEYDGDTQIECITGEDNQIERKRILQKVNESKKIILISTQVIEAGVDIDMDLGYKNIAKLDSDEQFMGRINRNYIDKTKKGKVFFFSLDKPEKIYHNDFRVNSELMLNSESMRRILSEKEYENYYSLVMNLLKSCWNDRKDKNGLESFESEIENLKFKEIEQRMKLIDDRTRMISVFFSMKINDELDGKQIWEEYKNILNNKEIDYSKKKYLLSVIKSKLPYFIYNISYKAELIYDDYIGELYYISDGENYFINGKLDEKKFLMEESMFI